MNSFVGSGDLLATQVIGVLGRVLGETDHVIIVRRTYSIYHPLLPLYHEPLRQRILFVNDLLMMLLFNSIAVVVRCSHKRRRILALKLRQVPTHLLLLVPFSVASPIGLLLEVP